MDSCHNLKHDRTLAFSKLLLGLKGEFEGRVCKFRVILFDQNRVHPLLNCLLQFSRLNGSDWTSASLQPDKKSYFRINPLGPQVELVLFVRSPEGNGGQDKETSLVDSVPVKA